MKPPSIFYRQHVVGPQSHLMQSDDIADYASRRSRRYLFALSKFVVNPTASMQTFRFGPFWNSWKKKHHVNFYSHASFSSVGELNIFPVLIQFALDHRRYGVWRHEMDQYARGWVEDFMNGLRGPFWSNLISIEFKGHWTLDNEFDGCWCMILFIIAIVELFLDLYWCTATFC